MPEWKKPSGNESAEPIDVLLLGAVGSRDWRRVLLPLLEEKGLVWHDPGGILVSTDGLPSIGSVVVGLGDPGFGNAGIEEWIALGRFAARGYGSADLVVFRFGELEGSKWTEHDRDVFASLEEVFARSRVYVATDPAELVRLVVVRRPHRWDADVEVETVTTTTTKKRRR